jgi:hypothetical protein
MPLGGLLTVGLISAGTSIAGGLIGKSASKTAAGQQTAAIEKGVNLLGSAKDESLGTNHNDIVQQKSLLAPEVNLANHSIYQLVHGLEPGAEFHDNGSITPAQILAQNPGYQFQIDQGTQAIQKAAAAQGTGVTGGELKDLAGFVQGNAQNAYQQAFTNYNTTNNQNFARMLSAAGVGEAAKSTENQDIQNYTANDIGVRTGTAQNQAQALSAEGTAQAAGTLGGANAINGMLGGLGGTATGLLQAKQYQDILKSLSTSSLG